MSLLKAGLHPLASDALRSIGVTPDRLSQTVGSASASAGSHEADGTANGVEYCAATDFRIRDYNEQQVRLLLSRLALVGFAGWYREPGSDHWPDGEARHIHAVYAGVPMKEMLRRQVRDWLSHPMLNGLASHAPYRFWNPSEGAWKAIQTQWEASGHGTKTAATTRRRVEIHVAGQVLIGELDAAGITYVVDGAGKRTPVRNRWPGASFSWDAPMRVLEVSPKK